MSLQPILACAVVVAALVVRSAVAELKKPGEARRQWEFLMNKTAAAIGGSSFLAVVGAVAVSGLGWGHLAWAVLAGLLTAFVTDQLTGES
ncbi:hypothetical protein OG742_22595 [Streptomyces sp. NBC_00828]|uniref:hypothetical protein n=1 Tax=Streptomyces sp. NBC_00828 TaxID=2903678 RepID=UPI00386BDC41